MSIRALAFLSVAGLVLAACTGAGSGGAVSTAPSGPATTRIDVRLSDALKMEPAAITVPAGVPVTFVVTNTGTVDHEFFLGDEAAQAEHEQEMQAGGMMHGDPAGISLKAGESKELTHTFEQAGATLAGCHVAGHYAGGMRATITVAG